MSLVSKKTVQEWPRFLHDFRIFIEDSPSGAESATTAVNINLKPGRLHRGPRVYKMESDPKGYVLLINNENFEDPTLKFRSGTHIDGDRLSLLFKDLGFKLYKGQQFWNQTKKVVFALEFVLLFI